MLFFQKPHTSNLRLSIHTPSCPSPLLAVTLTLALFFIAAVAGFNILFERICNAGRFSEDEVRFFGPDCMHFLRVHCVESGEESSDTVYVYALKCHISQDVNHLHEGIKHLFFSYFKELVGKEVTVELKNDLAIRGTLHSVDQLMSSRTPGSSIRTSAPT